MTSLRELSKAQYSVFKNTVNKIITSDKTIDLNEWVIQRLVLQQLDEHFSIRKTAKEKYAYLGDVKNDAESIMEASRTLMLPPGGELSLSSLQPGECLVKQVGPWPHAMLGKIDYMPPCRTNTLCCWIR